MPNRDFAEDQMGLGGSPSTKVKKPRGGTPALKVKPAFGSIGLPGKSQPKSRNAGVRKAKVNPRDVGL